MNLNLWHVAIWAIIWLAGYKVGSRAFLAYTRRPGDGRHTQ
jgi:hypothetical protein